MNHLYHHLTLCFALAFLCHALAEELPQDQRIVREGDKTYLRFHGVLDRTYFFQTSKPGAELKEWLWLPEIRSGTGAELSLEIDGTADRRFFRMKYTDQPVPEGETAETADFDGDGLGNLAEISIHGTDPCDPDSDKDLLPDGFEVAHGLNPTFAGYAGTAFPGSDLTYLEAFQSGLQNHPDATLADLDGDEIPNELDADPRERLIDWTRSPAVSSYAVIDLNMEPVGSFLPPHGRIPVDAVLNDWGLIGRRADSYHGEKTPAVWDGTTFPPVWTNLPDFVNANGNPETLTDPLQHSLDNAGRSFQGHFLDDGSDGSAGQRAVTIIWDDPVSAGRKYGSYGSETHRAVVARFDHLATEDYDIAEEPAYEKRTVTAGAFITTGTDGDMPHIGAVNFYSYAPAISRTGKVLVHQSGQIKINDIPAPSEHIYGLTADPHGKDLVVISPSSSYADMVSHRHRNGEWEKMPMPAIMDMNADGTGITFPEHQIWSNGSTIQLDELLEESGWTEFKAEQINARGVILGSAIPDGETAHKPVLMVPATLVAKQSGGAETEDGAHFVTLSDPKPEVEITVDDSFVNAQGELEIHVSGSVRDRLSEVLATNRISQLSFKVNGSVIHTLQLAYGLGDAPWTLADSYNEFSEILTIPYPRPGGYEVRAETDENAAGNTGWGRVAVGLTREDDPTADIGVFNDLSVALSALTTDTEVDQMTVYFGDRAPEPEDEVFTETAVDSGVFTGTLVIGGVSRACEIDM